MAKKKKDDSKDKVKQFFNSAHPLVCALILVIIFLIGYAFHLTKINKTYMFNGQGEYIYILNGVIGINYDIDVFVGSDITYIAEKDYAITKYEIGYYINGIEPIAIAVKSGSDETGLSLRGILMEASGYNVFGKHQSFMSKEAIKNLDNGLFFVITATTKDGTEIEEVININLTKVSK